MIKTIPHRVPKILKSGHNTYKPEMKEAIKMQEVVLSEFISGVPLSDLYEKATDKRYNETCDYLEKAFNDYDGSEDWTK